MDNLRYWLDQQLKGNHSVALQLSPTQQDLHGLTLTDAIKAHEAWIEKLNLTLRGQAPEQYDPDIVGVDHLCAVGKWLYGDGKELSKFPEYDSLKADHAAFHECAGNILRHHQKKHFTDALALLRNDLVDLSRKVQISLVSLLAAYQDSKR
ncbi:MAG: CZB domain-containing protein [Neisseriaceae bacterium]|nr:CZB domain-containing protein [Neisseriaceae bacterium]